MGGLFLGLLGAGWTLECKILAAQLAPKITLKSLGRTLKKGYKKTAILEASIKDFTLTVRNFHFLSYFCP